MADADQGNRPLSPHLQIYRPQMTSIVSILNRITGVALTGGAVLIVWWFTAAAVSPAYFAYADGMLTSWFGNLVMLGMLWALWFHTLGGIRHLVWDTGRHFDIDAVTKTGWGIVVGSFLMTALTVLIL